MTSAYRLRQPSRAVTYPLTAEKAASMIAAYCSSDCMATYQLEAENGSNDVNVQILVQIYTYQSERDEVDITNVLYIIVRPPFFVMLAFLRITSCSIISTQCLRCHQQKHETSLTIPTACHFEESLPRVEIAHHNIYCNELSLLEVDRNSGYFPNNPPFIWYGA